MFSFLKQYNLKRYNYPLLVVVILLGISGAYFVKFAGGSEFADSNFKKQLVGLFVGLLIAFVVSMIDYHFICRFAIVYSNNSG